MVSRAVSMLVCASIPLAAQFSSSTPMGERTAASLRLTLDDAIARGLKANLGLLVRENASASARVDRMNLLALLLPTVTAGVALNSQQVNLASFGFRIKDMPSVIGPFHYEDARARANIGLYDPRAWKSLQSNNELVRAAALSVKDARDLVVEAVASAYLRINATGARVEAARVQADTAQALFERARDQHRAGTSPAIDELRAEVEWKRQQQSLLALRNQVEKDKLALARAIGLPPGQTFVTADASPYQGMAAVNPDQLLERAYASRADYQSAQARIRAAELMQRAAIAEWLPRAVLTADYGVIGETLATSHGTFSISGSVTMNLFDAGKRKADILATTTALKQRKEELSNLKGEIDQAVRAALLDLNSAAEQVSVANSGLALARLTLEQARDRFAAGVTDNIEVIQAQQAVASGEEAVISSVYAHNLAKVALARALGDTETNLKAFLGGR